MQELYKSFADKVALIDEALELGDGNAILAVSVLKIVSPSYVFVLFDLISVNVVFLGVAVPKANVE